MKLLRHSLWAKPSKPSVSLLRQHRRWLSDYITGIQPNVGKIYASLLDQSIGTPPIDCNFISQVVDVYAKDPKRVAIRCYEQDSETAYDITYSEISENSYKIGRFFKDKGIKKGNAVALMLGQHPTWWYSLAGLMRQGIAVVPCPRLLTSTDLAYRVSNLPIHGIITSPEQQEKVDLIRNRCPSLRVSVTTGLPGYNWASLQDIFSSNMILSNEKTTTADPCLYLYTSGTTGPPKAVQHNYDYPFFHWPTGRLWLQATPQDLIYNASDTGWGFTVWVTTAVWATGSKLLITPSSKKFNPIHMLDTLLKHSVTIFCAAPTVLRMLVSLKEFDNYEFPSLKRIVTVGEALDEFVIEKFESKGIQVAVGFGQAETPLLTGRVKNQPHIKGTMGKPIEPYKITILDEDLKPSPPEQPGQIAVDLIDGHRNGLLRCYANAPEKTEQAFSKDGRYYLTGDLAKYKKDRDGSLYPRYLGRKDDLIISRGYTIGPTEVEDAGMLHPAIAKIAVVGVRTSLESLAITVKAFILLKPGFSGNHNFVNEIQEHIKKETAPYKYPREIEFMDITEWEQYETTSGKIRRAGLRAREEKKLLDQSGLNNDLFCRRP